MSVISFEFEFDLVEVALKDYAAATAACVVARS